jgi:hypothetical protein
MGQIYEFDGHPLPMYNSEQDRSTGTADSSLVDSLGSTFDYRGARASHTRKVAFSITGIYSPDDDYWVDELGQAVVDEGGERIIASFWDTELTAQVADLKAKVGTRGILWRRRLDDTTVVEWKRARLLKVPHRAAYKHKGYAEVEAHFETTMLGWRSAASSTVAQAVPAGAPTILFSGNLGDYIIQDAVITVARTTGTITAVQITDAGIDISWVGSIAAGQTLTIDAGESTVVRSDGTNQYAGFSLGAGHTATGWLPLALGNNSPAITVTGGNALVTVEYYNQWA